jgi:hypothetical protein
MCRGWKCDNAVSNAPVSSSLDDVMAWKQNNPNCKMATVAGKHLPIVRKSENRKKKCPSGIF